MTNKEKVFLLVIASLFLFVSCKTWREQRHRSKATTYAYANLDWLASLCTEKFKPQEKVVIKETFKKGPTEVTQNIATLSEDMIYQIVAQTSGDLRAKLIDSLRNIRIQCPPSTNETDTVFIDTSKTIIDNALVYVLQNKVQSLKLDSVKNSVQLGIVKKQRNVSIGINALWVIVGLVIAYFKMKAKAVKNILT